MTAFVHQIDGGEDEARKRQALELHQVTPSSVRSRNRTCLGRGFGNP